MRRILTIRRAAVTTCAAALLTACGGSPDDVSWEAFYYPTSNVVLLHAVDNNQCGLHADVKATQTTVQLHVVRHTPAAGRGSCPSPAASLPVQLQQPVDARTIQATKSSPGTSFDIANRLHQPIHGSDGLPSGAQTEPGTNDQRWLLTYHTADVTYQLISAPVAHPSPPTNGTVRGHPKLSDCPGTLCWTEDQLTYEINVVSPAGSEPATSTAARLAQQLALG